MHPDRGDEEYRETERARHADDNRAENVPTGLRLATGSGWRVDRSNGLPRALQKSSRFFRLVITRGWFGA